MADGLECDIPGLDTHWDKNWHIIALFAVIGASAVGVFLPIILQTIRGINQLALPSFPIQLGQFFGAGIIIATAFLHLFPAATDALSNPCLGEFADRYSAWAWLIAMTAVFSIHTIEWWLVEAWIGRTNQDCGYHCTTQRNLPLISGIDHGDSGDERADDDDDNMLFPAYPRAFNGSRMILPPPAMSPPVNPFVFGTSTVSQSTQSNRGKVPSTFALSKYGNYAALMQSRQHLAMVQNERMSRYLYSDPQFPMYAPSSIWPMPPVPPIPGMRDSYGLPVRGSVQAKSTPELMRKHQKSLRLTNGTSTMSSSAKAAAGYQSNGVSLRTDSFSNTGRKSRRQSKKSHRSAAEDINWKQRCVSATRLPPTTLEAGLSESLLEPLPPIPDDAGKMHTLPPVQLRAIRNEQTMRAKGVADWRSSGRSSVSPQSLGRSNHTDSFLSSRPISAALVAPGKGSSKRLSLQAFAARGAANRSSGERSNTTSPSARLDTVHETDDSWTTSQQQRNQHRQSSSVSEDGSAALVFASATSAMPPPLSGSKPPSRQATFHSSKSPKRVSIPTPPVLRAAPSSCAFRSISAASSSDAYANRQPNELGGYRADNGEHDDKFVLNFSKQHADMESASKGIAVAEGDDDSTAIHSKSTSIAQLSMPVEVKRRALATHVLEVGIALYSVLIGLALAISDSGFIALFIAICFHQFFEGLALGTSLAELYWIKAQIAAHHQISDELAADIGLESTASAFDSGNTGQNRSEASPSTPTHDEKHRSVHHAIQVDGGGELTTRDVDQGNGIASERNSNPATSAPSDAVCSDDFERLSPGQHNRQSKSRRTLASMATSFTPEPWLVNPHIEKALGTENAQSLGQRGPSTTQPPDVAAAAVAAAAKLTSESNVRPLPKYLQPRNKPERLPGWWKAWLSALVFCATTPTGIIIGLALHNIYEPHSRYALLLNGVLQSICTGILVYAGLVTLMIGGFNSAQVKQMPRLYQALLFFAVYAGAAVMAGLKIWK
ncbi:low-affinity Zn(2+) transporter zrt2 [Coemansia guatemalensis]|uniref:Low-affinity Zn(2+) transporter zrt2 n=1 Tax=Coemansia guatemalensis TaxID=2761395 RepID=A0A9W8I1J4_9FUNG|nr:low-affinity Zn(2+) transporter zrt2 [Coemansia guatemalensis]